MKNSTFRRALSLALVFCLLVTLAVPAFAQEEEGITFEKVENSEIKAPVITQEPAETAEVEYFKDGPVRVSIVLEENSVLEEGYSTTDIAENDAAMEHMDKVRKNQEKMIKKIRQVIGGDLEVFWQLALTANIISAEVEAEDIPAIEAISGISEVVPENQFKPCQAVPSADPKMIISSGELTGATQAWADGYTGAGMRIAIIDTGLDLDHQSFDNDAFLYSLKQNAAEEYKEIYGNDKKVSAPNADRQLVLKDSDSNSWNVGGLIQLGKKIVTTALKCLEKTMAYQYSQLYMKKLDLLEKRDISKVLSRLNVVEYCPEITAEELMASDKVPFIFNYVDKNTNVSHLQDTTSQHGSHVAGISAANRYIKSGNGYVEAMDAVYVAGVAPDAQVLVMKVFGANGGAYESDFMAAIEDSILLGCDAVNLSMGSSVPGMVATPYQDIMDRLTKSDTVVAIAVGNEGYWAEVSYPEHLWADDVNYHAGGFPGSWDNSFTVASAQNAGAVKNYFTVGGKKFTYSENTYYGNAPINSLAANGDREFEYIFVDGIGTESDYAGLDLAGKVVFCSRGEINFADKANIAAALGAAAVIIYDNQPGFMSLNLEGYQFTAPCLSITQAQGADIREKSTPATTESGLAYYTGKLTVNQKVGITELTDEVTMSSFSSWGVPGDLSLKPEITAPGGNIYSVNGTYKTSSGISGGTDAYALMSGTSMATPQISGMIAAMKQYIQQNRIRSNKLTDRGLIQSLLMSTANVMYAPEGYIYPVLQQGAGIANLTDAMNAATYVVMNKNATDTAADGKVKAELGDDPARKGTYSFTFTLNNITSKSHTYKLSADVFTQATDGQFLLESTQGLDANVTFTVNGKKASSVTVGKNKSATVKVTITLTEETKAMLDAYYVNGAYVEAFVYAKSTDKTASHSIPVLGFYGNWTDPSMFDKGSYVEYAYGLENIPPYLYEYNNIYTNAYTVSFAGDPSEYYFGGNLFARDAQYLPERNAMNNTVGDRIQSVYYTLIRNAGLRTMTISNTQTGEVYLSEQLGEQYAAYYNSSSYAWDLTQYGLNLGWAGTDAQGNPLPEGTTVTLTLSAIPEYYAVGESSYDLTDLGKGASFSTQLTIDNTAPEVNAIVSEEEGMLIIDASDNQYLAAVSLYANDGETLLANAALGMPEIQAVLAAGMPADVYLLQVLDYAGNASTYRVFMGMDVAEQVESVTIDQQSLYITKSGTAQLNAKANPINLSDRGVTWTSSDEAVATVDANGLVTGVDVGSCLITAASVLDPAVTAQCVVTVFAIETELHAAVWDDVGPWLSSFNTATVPQFQRLTESSWEAPITSITYGGNGTLYATDLNTSTGTSTLYTVDPSTYALTGLGTSNIVYTDIAPAPHLGDILLATYFNHVVLVDAATGAILGVFINYSTNDLVGITYCGSLFNTYYQQYIDLYYILDNKGNLYMEAFINVNGQYQYFNGAEQALFMKTGISSDISYYQSIYFDGTYTYISNFNAATKTVRLYAADTEATGNVYPLGTFDSDIWPVGGLFQLQNPAAEAPAAAAGLAEAEVKQTASTEAITPIPLPSFE